MADTTGVHTQPLLHVDSLTKSFLASSGTPRRLRRRGVPTLRALDGVSFELGLGQILGVVGESGSGKSTLAKCLVRLLEPDRGRILYRGRDMSAARGRQLVEYRRAMQLIYQNPYSSLNPLISSGEAIAEPAWVHSLIERRGRDTFAKEMLGMVGLPEELAKRRPGELSGGQRQRVAIARAMAVRPRILIADEALSGLDVAAQAQILDLLVSLREDSGLAILLISHQLSVLARIADTTLVMYLGRVVEAGPTAEVFSSPAHPYTAGLIAAQPGAHRRATRRSAALYGEIPSPMEIPSGCRFRTRCPRARALCATVDPPSVQVGDDHHVCCHFPG